MVWRSWASCLSMGGRGPWPNGRSQLSTAGAWAAGTRSVAAAVEEKRRKARRSKGFRWCHYYYFINNFEIWIFIWLYWFHERARLPRNRWNHDRPLCFPKVITFNPLTSNIVKVFPLNDDKATFILHFSPSKKSPTLLPNAGTTPPSLLSSSTRLTSNAPSSPSPLPLPIAYSTVLSSDHQ